MEKTAAALGNTGVLPLLLAAVGIWLFDASAVEWMLHFFRVWSAVLLTFLGALWWGILLANPGNTAERRQGGMLVMGAMPAVAAAISLLMPPPGGLLVAAGGFVLFRWLEKIPSHRDLYPSWFDPLRARLSWMVVVCHVSMITWVVNGQHA
ncbi:MAG: DUF3429 domain-containing protein [Gammaproteobacteria bacterium]